MPSPDFTNDDRFDSLYMNVANTARGIEPLLDTMFSFLRRKTDFFNGPDGQNTDVAVAKVNEVLQKHVKIQEDARRKKEEEIMKKQQKKMKLQQQKEEKEKKKKLAAAAASAEDGVIELGDDGFDVSSSNDAKVIEVPTASKKKDPPTPQDQNTKSSEDTKNEKESSQVTKNDDDDDDDDGPAPVGNGGTIEGKYVWTQSLSELNVTVSLPENTRGRDLQIVIKKKHLCVALKSQLPTRIVDAPLSNTIICDDTFWTVEDGNRLVISLQKMNQMEWWDSVCEGDPKIDLKKVQPENSKLDDLDGDTRQTVEKMMFDQKQKALGLPSSDEQRKFDMLDKFKKAHPEMDFSNAKIS